MLRSLVATSRALRQQQAQLGGRAAAAAAQRCGFAKEAAELQELEWDDKLDALAQHLTGDEARRELAALKSTFYDIKGKYDAMCKPVAPIDWEEYKKQIDPKLVEMFKEAYESVPVPEYPGTEVEEAKAAFDALKKEADAIAADSAKRMKEIEAEIAQVKKELERVRVMTVDEGLAENPAIAKEVDQEISEGKWF